MNSDFLRVFVHQLGNHRKLQSLERPTKNGLLITREHGSEFASNTMNYTMRQWYQWKHWNIYNFLKSIGYRKNGVHVFIITKILCIVIYKGTWESRDLMTSIAALNLADSSWAFFSEFCKASSCTSHLFFKFLTWKRAQRCS